MGMVEKEGRVGDGGGKKADCINADGLALGSGHHILAGAIILLPFLPSPSSAARSLSPTLYNHHPVLTRYTALNVLSLPYN